MRIIVTSLSLLGVAVFVTGCAGHAASRVHLRPATGQAIITAMGQGLLGPAFDSMSRDARRRALEAEYKSLEYTKTGETVAWQAGNGAASGTVVPGQPYRVGSQNCRQYSHSFSVDGVAQTIRGSACRNPDGSWVPLT